MAVTKIVRDLPYPVPSDEAQVREDIKYLGSHKADREFPIVTSAPSDSEGRNGEIRILDATPKKIFVKVAGSWLSATLS